MLMYIFCYSSQVIPWISGNTLKKFFNQRLISKAPRSIHVNKPNQFTNNFETTVEHSESEKSFFLSYKLESSIGMPNFMIKTLEETLVEFNIRTREEEPHKNQPIILIYSISRRLLFHLRFLWLYTIHHVDG